MEYNTIDVSTAFDILLEEIETEIGLTDKAGAEAFEQRNHNRARQALERADLLTVFRSKVVGLRDEWNSSLGSSREMRAEEKGEHPDRRNFGRLQKGRKTPESVYYRLFFRHL